MTNVVPGRKGFQCLPAEERFWAKVEIRDPKECWPWTGGGDQHGRGQFWMDGKLHRSPRLAWSFRYRVPFPDELHACHTCDNPKCCNPAHIWPGTSSQNIADASRKQRLYVPAIPASAARARDSAFCGHGHEYTPENTRITKLGARACRICARRNNNTYAAKKRARAAIRKETTA